MTALLDQLDQIDRLVSAAHRGVQSEDFTSEVHDAIDKVTPVRKLNQDFWDANYILARSIVAYESHPTPESIGEIRDVLVDYRRTATS